MSPVNPTQNSSCCYIIKKKGLMFFLPEGGKSEHASHTSVNNFAAGQQVCVSGWQTPTQAKPMVAGLVPNMQWVSFFTFGLPLDPKQHSNLCDRGRPCTSGRWKETGKIGMLFCMFGLCSKVTFDTSGGGVSFKLLFEWFWPNCRISASEFQFPKNRVMGAIW